jgi:membrane-bound lytic murein transglycosylase D
VKPTPRNSSSTAYYILIALAWSLLLGACSHPFLVSRTTDPAISPVNAVATGPVPPPETSLSENVYRVLPPTGSRPDPETAPRTTFDTPPEVTRTVGANGGPQAMLDEALDFCRASQEFWQKGELEQAIEALDQAYALVLGADTGEDFEVIQQKEDLRFMISKRILEIYASRNIVANGQHDAIPMVRNRHVEAEIQRFTTGPEKDFFARSLRRSGRFRPMIVAAMREAGLPEELSWLPLIESGFNVRALSPARALGLWQFIPSTGYKFGLRRDQFIDERMDPEKATQAAIAYLKELHQMFGDWATVLAAYNCGEGRVLRVIRTQNVNYLDNFWDLYERLPRETARYVPRFLATLHVLKNPAQYGIQLDDLEEPLVYSTASVSRQIHLRDAAQIMGVSEASLRELNPELRYGIVPEGRYDLRIPEGKSEAFLANLDRIPESSLPQPAYVQHRVRNGESLSSIARRYGTTVGRIMRANNLRSSHYIVAGKRLRIPTEKNVIAHKPATAQPVAITSTHSAVHVVQGGDSLWNIAQRYGTTVGDIQELNGLSGTRLQKGQSLRIPGHRADAKTPSGTGQKVYEVKTGDSPFRIAQSHNMSVERLLRLNRLSPRAKIHPGQQLFVE